MTELSSIRSEGAKSTSENSSVRRNPHIGWEIILHFALRFHNGTYGGLHVP